MDRIPAEKDFTRIVVLDDEPDCANVIKLLLNYSGMENVQDYNDPHKLLDEINNDVRIAIIDQDLKTDMTGLQVISKIVNKQKHVCFIMISGSMDIDVSIAFMDLVNDSCKYIKKGDPNLNEKLIRYVRRFIMHFRLLKDIYSGMDKVDTCLEKLDNILDRKPSE